jgi:hypothetical protein
MLVHGMHERQGGELDEMRLREIALSRLAQGALPREPDGELRAGLGHDGACSVCGLNVSSQEIELRVLAANADSLPNELRFHTRCYIAWHRVCHPADGF